MDNELMLGTSALFWYFGLNNENMSETDSNQHFPNMFMLDHLESNSANLWNTIYTVVYKKSTHY